MSQIRVKDYTGKVIHKKKRGFATKKEALEWERDFLNKATADMGMLFQDFVEPKPEVWEKVMRKK